MSSDLDQTSPFSPEQRANLTAYLDGELEEPASRQIESTLASSPAARRELDLLARTWELLDELPGVQVSEEFTERTLSSISAHSAPTEAVPQTWPPDARRGIIVSGWAAAIVSAAAIGFLWTHNWIPGESDQLVEQLPIIEKLDAYSEVNDIQYLLELKESGLFDDEQ